MNRAKCTIHMYTTLDGKIETDIAAYPDGPQCYEAGEMYDDITFSKFRSWGCGRNTYDDGTRPDLSPYAKLSPKGEQPLPSEEKHLFFAFDRMGKLNWKGPYNDYAGHKSRIVEVVSSCVDPRYLTHLERLGIPYLFAGNDGIDPRLFLERLSAYGIDSFCLCGGPEINAAFLRAGVVDEISLVVAPGIQGGRRELSFVGSDNLEGFPLYFVPKRAEIGKRGALYLLYGRKWMDINDDE